MNKIVGMLFQDIIFWGVNNNKNKLSSNYEFYDNLSWYTMIYIVVHICAPNY